MDQEARIPDPEPSVGYARVAIDVAGRPATLAAAVGLWGAWPLEPVPPAMLVGCLTSAVVVAAESLRPMRPTRTLATLASILALGAATILQRPDEAHLGLLVLIGCAMLLDRAWRAPTNAPVGVSGRLLAWGMALVAVLLPQELGLPRSLLVGALCGLGALDAAVHRHWVGGRLGQLVEGLLASPARLLVVSFAGLIAGGSILLALPIASTRPGTLPVLDALFTAVSATCVTGLIVLDTPNDLTLFGQGVVLALMQLGGLGIMSFAAAVSVYLGRRLRVREELAAAEAMGHRGARTDLDDAVRGVVRVTAVSELLGAATLTSLFWMHGDPLPTALWRAVFTAVSAFCNAGFALQTDSLVPYQTSPAVLLTVSGLIIVGGLGPVVVGALPTLRRGHPSLHVRLVVTATALLLAIPTLAILLLEWNHGLSGLALSDKLVNGWFQSVTLRTAGFNSIDIASVQPATWTLMIVCMSIGGSPGSTAGGMKTTTFAILLLAVVTAIRGRTEATVFGRRIPHKTVYEAAAVAAVGVLASLALLASLQVTQALSLDVAAFEAVSALGTVGLSMGATGSLDDVGKVLVSIAMFAGRVGPLTLFVFLVGRERTARRYPLEAVPIG